ncbi:deoxyribonuclease-2-beta-like isoform X2 [Xiphophorus maculatus]|uniref:deoxyribonuclease-2-beta-like isoform X2 n=1 Tax=Xiphophorus maculatus TaxID=8083 RepID=UPI000C6CA151|nr:deoxyribonuclease-2-beta-like isoform X2 [Xiphophorus maculatus]
MWSFLCVSVGDVELLVCFSGRCGASCVFQWEMWSFLLVFGLLCWGSHGSVTCKDDSDAEVDWYILYKMPYNVPTPNEPTTGTEYFYMDSKGRNLELNNINSANSALGNTLRPLFRSIRNMDETFGFISYSDQPPGCDAKPNRFGHSKGLVMVDSTSTGVWILHSTPQFPFRREQNNFWPTSGNRNAQTFICVTFNYNQFTTIGTHLKYINAFPFEHYIPDDFHEELKNVVKWTEGSPYRPDKVEVSMLTSKGNQGFQIFAKQAHNNEEVGDLYRSIANNIKSDIYAQTWRCPDDQSKSYCPSPWSVINVEGLRVGNQKTWNPNVDHSKWCVAKDQNKHWTCIADMNRAVSQFKRFGGALCIHLEWVQRHFLRFVNHPQPCLKRRLVCDPNSDGDNLQIIG